MKERESQSIEWKESWQDEYLKGFADTPMLKVEQYT